MATLKKMTRMGADVRQIARLLQAKAPEGHMLAYITPEEAELLKSQGGSGKPHADTGVPSFAPDFDYSPPESVAPAPELSSSPVASVEAPAPEPVQNVETPVSQDRYNMGVGGGSYGLQPDKSTAQPYSAGQGFQASASRLAEMPTLPSFIRTPPPETVIDTSRTTSETVGDKFRDLAKGLGVEESTLGKLGVGGIQALLGARTARKAAEQGKAGKAEIQALAQPYQAKGAELQRAAQAGELTPQSQQALQAVQAQAAQQATSRGGVGTMQSQAQVEAFRQQLLAQQYDYGLKLSGIGDNIALGAIKTGLQADQYVQQISSNYMNNIMRTLYGVPPQVAGAPAQSTPQA